MSYYLMHRGWLDHPAFGSRKREPFCRAAAWAWLIDHAVFDAKRIRIAGKIVTLARGQLSYSLRYLGDAWGWQHDRVRRFLGELENRDMIATDSATGQVVVTICNYSEYQNGHDTGATAPEESARQHCDSTATNNKEGKEGKESKNLSSSPTESPSPARAREAPPEVRATPAEEEGDFKIPEKWIEDVRDERRYRDLPELDLHELARQTVNRWHHDPPHNRWLAWRGRALTATLNPSLVPSPSRADREEEARLIEAAKQQALAQLRAGTYVWEAAA